MHVLISVWLVSSNKGQIGINLGDPIFRGEYHGKQRHEDDFNDVLQRGLNAGCKKFMVTGSDLEESKHAIEIAKAHRESSTFMLEVEYVDIF